MTVVTSERLHEKVQFLGTKKHSRLFWYIIACILVLAVVVRVALPFYLRHAINQRLSNIPGYQGHVGDVGLSIYRGAYQLNDLSIMKSDMKLKEPFFASKQIDFSIAWRDLFHGKFVSDILIDRGQINIVKGPTQQTSQTEADKRWQSVVNDLFPIDITHFELRQGSVRFIETDSKPYIDLSVNKLDVVVEGLRNRPTDTKEEFPAKLTIRGTTIGGGELDVFAEGEPLADQPHFNLKVQLNKVDLTALNEFLLAYGNVDVSKGQLQTYLEMGAKGGRFEGYVKPFFSDLEFKDTGKNKKNLGQRIWEKVVAGLADVLKNRKQEQVATRIPFSGDFSNTNIGVWTTIRYLFHNGFIRALNQGLEGSVKADNVKPTDSPKDQEKASEASQHGKEDSKPESR